MPLASAQRCRARALLSIQGGTMTPPPALRSCTGSGHFYSNGYAGLPTKRHHHLYSMIPCFRRFLSAVIPRPLSAAAAVTVIAQDRVTIPESFLRMRYHHEAVSRSAERALLQLRHIRAGRRSHRKRSGRGRLLQIVYTSPRPAAVSRPSSELAVSQADLIHGSFTTFTITIFGSGPKIYSGFDATVHSLRSSSGF